MRPDFVRPITKTRDNGRCSQRRPCQRWNRPKIWSSSSAFLPDLLLADDGQCPGTGLQVVVQEVIVPLLSLLLPVSLLLLLRLSMLLLLSQMLMSSQLPSVDHDARPVAPGTQHTPLVSPRRLFRTPRSLESVAVPARLSLAWSSASCMPLATHHALWNGRCHRTFLPSPKQASKRLRCWRSLRR